MKVQETDYFTRQNVPAELNTPNVVSAIFESDIANGGANSEPLNTGDNAFVVVRVVDHKDEGTQTFDEAKAMIEQLLKREKAEKTLMAQADQLVKDLSVNPHKLPQGLSFSAPQTFSLENVKDPILTEGVFAMAKPKDGETLYQTARDSQGNVVVVALEKVEEGKLDSDKLAQFGYQLQQSRQLEVQGTLMQALRDKAKVEINEAFINQDDDN